MNVEFVVLVEWKLTLMRTMKSSPPDSERCGN